MSKCRYCDSPISWGCRVGQWVPTNADGSQHYCSERRRLPDVNHIAGKEITGSRYTPSCGACAVPPWEECDCSVRLAC